MSPHPPLDKCKSDNLEESDETRTISPMNNFTRLAKRLLAVNRDQLRQEEAKYGAQKPTLK
jgi:hypothetical protein